MNQCYLPKYWWISKLCTYVYMCLRLFTESINNNGMWWNCQKKAISFYTEGFSYLAHFFQRLKVLFQYSHFLSFSMSCMLAFFFFFLILCAQFQFSQSLLYKTCKNQEQILTKFHCQKNHNIAIFKPVMAMNYISLSCSPFLFFPSFTLFTPSTLFNFITLLTLFFSCPFFPSPIVTLDSIY